jgi:amino acid adenylation domain-containing protein
LADRMSNTDRADVAARIAALPRDQRVALERRLAARRAGRGAEQPIPARAPDEAPMLSFAQESLWLQYLRDPGSALGTVVLAVRIYGELHADVLDECLAEVLRRHEVLRMTVAEQGGSPVVRIAPLSAGPLAQLGVEGPVQEAALPQLLADEARRPFDLEHGPLVRARLIRLADSQVFILALHHIVADAHSAELLLRELTGDYAARLAGAPAAWPDLPVQYADYARWQRSMLSDEVLRRRLEFWRDELSDVPPFLALPGHSPGGAADEYAGATQSRSLGPELSSAVRRLAGQHRVTLFTVMMSAFLVALHRHTGQDRIAVATPVSGRTRPELEQLVGCFANTLIMRGDFTDAATFSELLRQVRDAVVASYEQQEIPLELVLGALQRHRDSGSAPYLQTMLVLEERMEPLATQQLRICPVTSGSRPAAKRDLTLTVTDSGGGLDLELNYAVSKVGPQTACQLMDSVLDALVTACAGPERPVDDFTRPTAAEYQRIVADWSRSHDLPAADASVHELFEAQVRCTPDATAVVDDKAQLTYSELDRASNRLAHRLRDLGVHRDSPVGICVPRGCNLVVGVLGILKAGAAYVPLDPNDPVQRFAEILADTGAEVVVTTATAADRLPLTVHTVSLDDHALLGQPDTAVGQEAAAAQLAYVLYTSGSTGRPKGVMVERRQLLSYVRGLADALHLDTSGSYAMLQPLTFDSCNTMFYPPLLGGGSLHIISADLAADGLALADYFERHAIDYVKIAPSHLRTLMSGRGEPAVFPRKALILGGEVSHWQLADSVQKRAAIQFVNHYGPTETTVGVLTHLVPDAGPRPGTTVPVGRPIPGVRAYILDGDLRPVPAGVPGDLHIGGSSVSRGYWRRPSLTARSYIPDPFGTDPGARLYRTGDRARFLADGKIEYLGRKDDQLNVRGLRVEPGEVEVALCKHPEVDAAVVVAAPEDSELGLIAYVVGPAPDSAPGPLAARLRSHLTALLPPHMIPWDFAVLERLPLSSRGKIDRKALPDAPSRRSQSVRIEPRDELERVIASAFADVLAIPHISAGDDFFALGGSSLSAMLVIADLRDRGLEVRLSLLLEHSTVAGLAAAMRDAGDVDAAAPGPRTGSERTSAPLSYGQESLWLLSQANPGDSAYNMPYLVQLPSYTDAAALGPAIRALIDRHEVLRTVVGVTDGQPWQRVLAVPDEPLELVDLSELPEADRPAARDDVVARTTQRPFRLDREPPLRAVLITAGTDGPLLALTLHHIAADAWSMRVLTRDLLALYRQVQSGGADGGLPPLPLQYADYALWQRTTQADSIEAQLGYWRERLAGPLPVLELPADRTRGVQPAGGADNVILDLTIGLADRLRGLAAESGTTLFTVLLAATQALLARLTGQRDVIVGVPVTDRGRPELVDLIGYFVTTLAMRADLSGDPSFAEFLSQVRASTLADLARRDIPFDRVAIPGEPGLRSVLPVVLTLDETTEASPDDLLGLAARPVEAGPAKFDLLVSFRANDTRFELAMEYSTDRFNRETVVRLGQYLRQILDCVTRAPALRIGDIELADVSAVSQTTAAIGRSRIHHPESAVHELFAGHAARRPDRTALVLPSGSVGYGELDQRADRLARYLSARGCGAQAPTAILLERSAELVISMLAVLKAGGAYLPLNPSAPAPRTARLLSDAGVTTVLTVSALAAMLPGPQSAILLDRIGDELELLPTAAPSIPAHPGRLAAVLYASKMPGRPTAIGVSSDQLMQLARGPAGAPPDPDEVVLCGSPVDLQSSAFEIWRALANGSRLVICPDGSESPAAIASLVAAHGVTTLWLPAGSLGAALTEHAAMLRSVRHLLVDRDGITASHARRAAGQLPWLTMLSCYGPAEWTVLSAGQRLDGPAARVRSVPIGRAGVGIEAHVLDSRGRPVPADLAGELWLGGDHVAGGYWRQPALTAAAFVPDLACEVPGSRMYRTGDIVRRRPDGELQFLGRTGERISMRGYPVEPAEVEAVLAAHPDVAEAVVAGDTARQLLAGFVVPARDVSGESLESALVRWASGQLPAHLVPTVVRVLSELPRLATGRVDRRALLAAVPSPHADRIGTAHTTEVERQLAAIFAELLEVPDIGIHDSFFDLGVNSLMGIRAAVRIGSVFGTELPITAILDDATVADLAAWLTGSEPRMLTGGIPIRSASGSLDAPLTFAQLRVWFLGQLAPEQTAYHIHGRWWLHGSLDAGLLARCMRIIVDRHEALRTVFPVRGDRPVQVVLPAETLEMSVTDLTGTHDCDAEAERMANASAAEPFDLATGPLMRASLVKVAAGKHLLALTVHHIVFDGLSAGLLGAELARLYAAGGVVDKADLPELPVQYRDYAAWQHSVSTDDLMQAQLDYWRTHLAGAPQSISLPVGHGTPGGHSPMAGEASLQLEPRSCAALRALFRENGVTTFMGMLAAMAAVLARWSGQDDVVIGVPIATRNRIELEPLIGFFMNTLAMRIRVAGNPTFAALLAQARTVALNGYANQEIPFERLVDELQPERDINRTPVFQVMLNVMNFPSVPFDLPGVRVESVSEPAMPPKFDMTLYVAENEDATFQLALSYRADRYETELMSGFLAQLNALLSAAADDPHRGIRDYCLAPSGRRPATVAAARRDFPRLEDALGSGPAAAGRPALSGPDGSYTFGQLDGISGQLARTLSERGVRPGQVVPVVAERGCKLVVAMLACLEAGAAFAVLDAELPAARRAALLSSLAGPVVLNATGEVLPGSIPVLATSEPAGPGPMARPGPAAGAAYVMHTSGTTGDPVGVLGSHEPVTHFIAWHVRTFGLTEHDRFGLLSGLSYDPMLRDVFTPMFLGAELCVPEQAYLAEPRRLFRWLADQEITVVHVTPMLIRLIAEGAEGATLPSLRWLFVGGDVLTAADAVAISTIAPSARAVSFYGTTETPQAMAYQEIALHDPADARTGLIGRPVDDVEIDLVNAVGEPAAAGEIGEILVRTPYLARGYLGRPGLTAGRFVPDPVVAGGRLYRTGDRGRWRGDGSLEFAGRGDRQVKVRGHRVELGEVEAALLALPGVAAAAVRVWPDAAGLAELSGYVVGAGLEAKSVRAALREILPGYAVPARVVVLERLPMTANGKLDWAGLPAPGGDRPGAETGYVAPVTPVQRLLAGIWAEVLGCAQVGIHDNFFTLGGHSLMAAQVVSRVRQDAGADIEVVELFQHPTIAGLADAVVMSGLAAASATGTDLLLDLEGMSDDEVREHLARAGLDN